MFSIYHSVCMYIYIYIEREICQFSLLLLPLLLLPLLLSNDCYHHYCRSLSLLLSKIYMGNLLSVFIISNRKKEMIKNKIYIYIYIHYIIVIYIYSIYHSVCVYTYIYMYMYM